MKWFLLPGNFICDLIGLQGDNRQIFRMYVNTVFWTLLGIAVIYLLVA